MIGKFSLGSILLMLGIAQPVTAQGIVAPAEGVIPAAASEMDDGAGNPDRGVRQTRTPAFTLLEHGPWQRRATDVSTSLPYVETSSSAVIATRGLLGRSRSSFARSTWLPWVYAAENRHGLPLGLLDALIWTESRYNPMALSHAGAVGLAQLMPRTAGDLGIANRYDPVANIEGGARYLRQMVAREKLITC
ncbi:MAG: transglycosylase SLT domain-containing protein [Novosphingobium sp.]|nr:transglycosylase SLT domain-containing protein [Novosphingobium sp.]